jgi:hypothetical protein
VELEQQAASWRKKGFEIAAISYDAPEVLKFFAEKRKLSYPLLSDAESKTIRAFGILNASIPEKNPFFGIPHPGTYLLKPSGEVISKYFEDDYTERYTAADLLVKEFGAAAGSPHQSVETKHLRLATSSTGSMVRPGQRIALILDVELAKGMHVYAPGAEGYIPVSWKFVDASPVKPQDAVYPKPRVLYLKAIKEKAPVFEGKVRVVREVTFANNKTLKPLLSPAGELVVESEFRYQACDAKTCYLPQTVPLRWKFIVEGHDGERVPKELRRPGLQ